MLDLFPNWVTYTWLPIRHFITIGIMYGIYSYARNDYEKLIVCSLVIIYVGIVEFGRAWGLSHVLGIGFFKKEIDKLRSMIIRKEEKLAKELKERYPEIDMGDLLGWDYEFEKEEMDEYIEKVKKIRVCSYISEFALSIMSTLAIIGILKIIL